MSDIRLVEVRSDVGAGVRGARLGVDAVIEAAAEIKSDLFSRYDRVALPPDVADTGAAETPAAKHIRVIATLYEHLVQLLAGIDYRGGEFPVILAGDHAGAGGTIAGLTLANPGRRLGVVWVDAHADIHSPWTTPSGNMHGMPLATAIAEDNVALARNQPDAQTIACWHHLQALGGVSPKIKPADIVYVGLRDTEPEEDALIERHHILCLSVADLRGQGADLCARRALEHLADCDLIYTSFDVDSLDPSVGVGTGISVADGLLFDETVALLKALVADPRSCAFEMVEINPLYDPQGHSGKTALSILAQVIDTIAEK